MSRPSRNPFYPLLGVVGFLFTITALSYCLGAVRGLRPGAGPPRDSHPLERLMERHGTTLLAGELLVLAVATVGAVALDQAGGRRERRDRAADAGPSGGDAP